MSSSQLTLSYFIDVTIVYLTDRRFCFIPTFLGIMFYFTITLHLKTNRSNNFIILLNNTSVRAMFFDLFSSHISWLILLVLLFTFNIEAIITYFIIISISNFYPKILLSKSTKNWTKEKVKSQSDFFSFIIYKLFIKCCSSICDNIIWCRYFKMRTQQHS